MRKMLIEMFLAGSMLVHAFCYLGFVLLESNVPDPEVFGPP